eukprot:scaffold177_cov334-Pavlova_lutheri.AAC.51
MDFELSAPDRKGKGERLAQPAKKEQILSVSIAQCTACAQSEEVWRRCQQANRHVSHSCSHVVMNDASRKGLSTTAQGLVTIVVFNK